MRRRRRQPAATTVGRGDSDDDLDQKASNHNTTNQPIGKATTTQHTNQKWQDKTKQPTHQPTQHTYPIGVDCVKSRLHPISGTDRVDDGRRRGDGDDDGVAATTSLSIDGNDRSDGDGCDGDDGSQRRRRT